MDLKGGVRAQMEKGFVRFLPSPTCLQPPVVSDPVARAEFHRLTQRLVDIAIELADLADGDPELECNGDEFEDSDGL